MENRRARRRSHQHQPHDIDAGRFRSEFDEAPGSLAPGDGEAETRRFPQEVGDQYTEEAFLRMEDADELLREHWQQTASGPADANDPIGRLLSRGAMWTHNNPWLYVLALGEKVAALGGHLEVNAVFDDQTVTLIREPGSEGHPPILDSVDGVLVQSDTESLTDSIDFDDPAAQITVPLSEDERDFLIGALVEWGGSARPADEIARIIGFTSKEDLYANRDRLIDAVRHGAPLAAWDWRRVLISAEISFGSDVYGVGWEWETVNQQTDRAGVLVLRSLQDKLIGIAVHAKRPGGTDADGPAAPGHGSD